MKFLKAIGAITVLIAVLIGVPALLAGTVGNPWPPGGWAEVQLVSSRTILGAVAALAWLLWIQFAAAVMWEIPAGILGHRSARNPFALPGEQNIARGLVHAILAVAVTASVVAPALTPRADAATTVAPQPVLSYADTATPAPVPTLDATNRMRLPHVTVKPGDTLWGLAATHLGDGARWRDIATLNHLGDRTIRPGQQLRLPADAAGLDAVRVAPGDTLSGIAATHLGDADQWPSLYEGNRDTIGSDPNLIRPGEILRIPHDGTPTPTTTRLSAEHVDHHSPGGPVQPEDHHDPVSTHVRSADRSPAPAEAHSTGAAAHDDGDILTASWVIDSLAAGAVLAGAIGLVLRQRRRSQFRTRRPGRFPTLPPTDVVAYEKSATVAGNPVAEAIEFLDLALRQLALDITDQATQAPPLAAVELTADTVVLHLTAPVDLPFPWHSDESRLRWDATPSIIDSALQADRFAAAAPYPLLATIGRDENDHWWLLNLEHLGTVTVAGDTTRAQDLLRYIAAELSIAPWADAARIETIGIGAEAERMSPDRVTFHRIVGDVTDEVLKDALETIGRAQTYDMDAATGRATQVDDDQWPARLVLVDAANAEPDTLQNLVDLINSHPDRTGTSVVVADLDVDGGFALTFTDTGHLNVAQVQLNLTPVGLPEDDAAACADLLTAAKVTQDIPMPIEDTATEGLEAMIDAAGSIRTELTIGRNVVDIDPTIPPAVTTLDATDYEYVAHAAVTVEDLHQLAPKVPTDVSRAIIDADPTLDADWAAWINPDPRRPRLQVLGNVRARGYADPSKVAGRLGFYTEILAFLAFRAHAGTTVSEVADAFGLQHARATTDVGKVRAWLGTNYVTGQPFLPMVKDSELTKLTGRNLLQLDVGPTGVLSDIDLFRRKKARAQALGTNGIEDLRDALAELVLGEPFSNLRNNGWSWLLDGHRHDLEAVVMIADTTTLLATHYLQQGDLEKARAAVTHGLKAAPYEETMHLHMAALLAAEGRPHEAERYLADRVFDRSDDGGAPLDPTARTRRVVGSIRKSG